MNRTITLNAIEPAQLSLRVPLGVELDLDLSFRSQLGQTIDPNSLLAQLVLIPRSRGGSYAYDFETVDSGAGLASVVVPSSVLVDPRGYSVELYQRIAAPNPDDPPIPVGLLAKGVVVTQGVSYSQGTALGPIVVPQVVGPVGPQGPIGPQGIQGEPGPANVLTIGTVTTGAPGTPATATVTGVSPNQVISFVIPRGDVGAQGIQGVQGIQGIQGVQGPVGPQGVKGDTGLTGATGPVGPQGIQGIKGDTGNTGATGPVGPAGPTGPVGPQGPQGPAGLDAINLISGTVDPVSGDGVVGDFYVNLTSGSLFGPKAASGTIWPVVKLTTYWS